MTSLSLTAQPELLAKCGRDFSGDLLNHGNWHRQRGLADPIQIPAAVAQVGELRNGLPTEALANAFRQVAAGRQAALPDELLGPVPLPHHVGPDELGDEVLRRHV